MFSGLAFFVLLPMLKRTLTITLDFDWFYRYLIPKLWKVAIKPGLEKLRPVHEFIISGLPNGAAREVGHNGNCKNPEWEIGSVVTMVTVLLLFYLVLEYLGPALMR